jgi:hypothetical protein
MPFHGFIEQVSDRPVWCLGCRKMIPAWRRYVRFCKQLDTADEKGKDFCRRCSVNVNTEKENV